MTIKEISKELNWSLDNNLTFISVSEQYNYLNEYLSHQKLEQIDNEIACLFNFKETLDEGNQSHVENYILSDLQGFTDYDGEMLAYITGAHDFTIGVFYSLETNKVFLKHPYSNVKESIDLDTLLELLQRVKTIFQALFV